MIRETLRPNFTDFVGFAHKQPLQAFLSVNIRHTPFAIVSTATNNFKCPWNRRGKVLFSDVERNIHRHVKITIYC